jgi:hypothetical protein
MEDVLTNYGFDTLGEFLETLFYNHPRGEEDPRKHTHVGVVTSFLNGSSTVKMANIIRLIYHHPQSRPKAKYPDQVDAAFAPRKPLEEIRFARPSLNAWATRIVGDEIYCRVGRLARKNDDPDSRTHIRATTNGRKPNAKVATWKDMDFTMQGLADQYREADELVWYISECFCAPRVNGEVVIRKRRHLTVTIDETTGLMSTDWYGEEEFEDVLIRLCGAEDELETSDEEDEPQPQDDVASDSDDDNDDVD